MRLRTLAACLPVICLVKLFAASSDGRLLDAVKNGESVVARALIQNHADVNAPGTDGTAPLHWAVYADDVETAELLIRAGANVNATNRYGVKPLSLACMNGDAAMIALLLKAGGNPNSALPEGETALMTAARTGEADSIKLLLAHGAEVNAQEGWRGQTALMWAAAEGHAEAVEALVAGGADIHARSKGGFTPLLFAVREGRTGVVQALLKAGADVNETLMGNASVAGTSALVLAVSNAHYELASLLLDAGADPNSAEQGETALHAITWVRKPGYASNDPAPEGSGNMDSLEIVTRLVAHGANVNARMTKRIRRSTSLNTIGATPFLLAARTGDTELMRLLYKLGADPLVPNVDRTTPLLAAAGVGTRSPGEDAGTEPECLEAVKVALELGNDVNAMDKNGETAMHGAAYKWLPSVVQFLADHGAKIEVWNQKDKKGWTPLRIAVGVHRGMNLRASPETAAVLKKIMLGAGASAEVEPEVIVGGATQ